MIYKKIKFCTDLKQQAFAFHNHTAPPLYHLSYRAVKLTR